MSMNVAKTRSEAYGRPDAEFVSDAWRFGKVGATVASCLKANSYGAAQLVRESLWPGAAYGDLVVLLNSFDDEAIPASLEGGNANLLFEAMQEASGVLRDADGAYDGGAADVLLDCLLRRLPLEVPAVTKILDCENAAARFRRRANARAEAELQRQRNAQNTNGSEQQMRNPESSFQAFQLPGEIAPAENLTSRARESAAGVDEFPFDGEPQYEELFKNLGRALHRRQCGHVLLVGERGVGKTTLLAELARRAATGRLPGLEDSQVIEIDCRYISHDESQPRLGAVLSHVAGQAGLIVGFRCFASMLRSSRGQSNKPLLLSFLSRASCRVIGLLTPREYEELVSDDPDMQEFFTRLDVDEPDVAVAIKLLRHFAIGLENRFNVRIEPAAVEQAVVLTANYILNQRLPAKALRILHRVCEDVDYERTHLGQPSQTVCVDDVLAAVSRASGVPTETLRGISERSDYEQALRTSIVGQDHVFQEIAAELGLIKAGLTDANKPASVILLIGQTGTGKTELAKALARLYSTSKRLKTYTLGNFIEPHSVAGIIGVPAGYVGHDAGGRLINDLNADPYAVFLLDEADKAHPDVLQPFLNLFDEGWIRDQRGALAYADKSIFILTTNVGQRMISDMVRDGKSMADIAARMKEALCQIRHGKSDRPVFTPEFLARIKRIIVFRPLDRDAMEGICRKLLAEMQNQWEQRRNKRLAVAEELIHSIADQSHRSNERSQNKEGGRIVRKLVAERIEEPIQRAIADRPDEYRRCAAVELSLDRATDPEGSETVVRWVAG